MRALSKYHISLAILWSFTIFGIIGFLSPAYEWFVALTPLNLGVYLFVLIWNLERVDIAFFKAMCIPFTIGMIAEILGVNTGWIFGSYSYGDNMGWKVLGVPWMIGVNWAVLTYASAVLAQRLSASKLGSVVTASLIMVFLDYIMEHSAPRFDYWEFEGGMAPLHNYLGWFATAIIAQTLFQSIHKTENNQATLHILYAIGLFFGIFLFL